MTGAGKLPVDPDLLARARQALLDASEALQDHHESVIVIGAQAIYLHTGAAATPVAEAAKDSDLAFDVRRLADQPHIDAAMRAANVQTGRGQESTGAWVSADGIPVDLMVPETLAADRVRALPRTRRTTSGRCVARPFWRISSVREGDNRVIVANVEARRRSWWPRCTR